jgi:hypothetical protein
VGLAKASTEASSNVTLRDVHELPAETTVVTTASPTTVVTGPSMPAPRRAAARGRRGASRSGFRVLRFPHGNPGSTHDLEMLQSTPDLVTLFHETDRCLSDRDPSLASGPDLRSLCWRGVEESRRAFSCVRLGQLCRVHRIQMPVVSVIGQPV